MAGGPLFLIPAVHVDGGTHLSPRQSRRQQRVGEGRVTDHRLPAAAAVDQVQIGLRLRHERRKPTPQAPFVEFPIDGDAVSGQPVSVPGVNHNQVPFLGVVLMYPPYGAGHVENENAKTEHEHHDAEEQLLADVMLLSILLNLLQKAHTAYSCPSSRAASHFSSIAASRCTR